MRRSTYILLTALLLAFITANTLKANENGIFNLSQDEAKMLPKWLNDAMTQAEEDYLAVIKGGKPVHATNVVPGPVLTDGGTVSYQGEGYTITVMKRLTNLYGVPGYTYGPIVTFQKKYFAQPFSCLRFYSDDAFNKLIGAKK